MLVCASKPTEPRNPHGTPIGQESQECGFGATMLHRTGRNGKCKWIAAIFSYGLKRSLRNLHYGSRRRGNPMCCHHWNQHSFDFSRIVFDLWQMTSTKHRRKF